MAFPASPTNGQTTTINGVSYTYNSTTGAWVRSGTASSTNPVVSVAGKTGAVTLVADDIGAGTFSYSGIMNLNNTTGTSGTTTGALVVAGGVGIAGSLFLGGSLTISGAINNTAIGSGGASTGAFSTLVASNNTQVASLGVGTAASGTAGEIRATNYITAFYSDARLKTEIGCIENALDRVDKLTGILYTQNKLAENFGYNNYEVQVGLRAQDVQIAQPEAVKPAPFDIADDGSSISGENYLTVQYEKLVPLLVEAIKELRVELNQLKGSK